MTFVEQPQLRQLGDTQGLGTPPAEPISTLAPPEPEFQGVRVDAKTGEPRRTWLIRISVAFFSAAAFLSFVNYWFYWWTAIHMESFAQSASLISWFNPRPGSALSVVLVCVMALFGVLTTAGGGVAAYNVWHGESWSKGASVFAIVASLFGLFFTPWTLIIVALSLLGALIVWIPATNQYFADWKTYNDPPAEPFEPPAWVEYGPLPRYLG